MRFSQGVTLVVFLLLFVPPVSGEIIQYFDEDGILVVTNNPFSPEQPRWQPPRSYPLNLNFRSDVSYEFYPVSGNTFHEVIQSVDRQGPFNERERKKFAAHTEWRMGLSYRYDYTYRVEEPYIHVTAHIRDVTFRDTIKVLLPALSGTSTLDEHDIRLWEDYLRRLLEHEHDHVDIVKTSAQIAGAPATISSLHDFVFPHDQTVDLEGSVREAVESETARVGHTLARAIRDANEEYDRITEHGLKQDMREAYFRNR